ncbi:MAG: SigE family RNA polymerase sigma factor [Propionibacterium sp.]|nr:SigE family RNA polymerase sigma factor [Propionibacterium sp.]
MESDVTASSLERFVAQRGRALLRAAWLLVGDDHHAEDLLQTALSKCYSRYDVLANDHKFEAYVRTTLYRTYVSWWRRLSWRGESTSDEVRQPPVEAADVALRVDVLKALDTLPRMQRAVLVMRYLEDRSIADVAKTLGISTGTVTTYTARGVRALREAPHLMEARA